MVEASGCRGYRTRPSAPVTQRRPSRRDCYQVARQGGAHASSGEPDPSNRSAEHAQAPPETAAPGTRRAPFAHAGDTAMDPAGASRGGACGSAPGQ